MNRARRKTVTVIGAWVGGTAGWVLSQPDVSFSPHTWLILLSLQMGLTLHLLPQVEAPSSCMHTLTWFLFKIPKKECWFSRHSSAQNPLLVSCLIPSKSSGNLVSYCLSEQFFCHLFCSSHLGLLHFFQVFCFKVSAQTEPLPLLFLLPGPFLR